MPSVLKIRDKGGNFVGIGALRGDRGKSAYEQAVEGGYEGSENEFNVVIANLTDLQMHITNFGNPHETTAEDVGALPIEGGTLTGQNLYLNNGTGRITSGEDFVQLETFDSPKDANNRRMIILKGVQKAQLPQSLILKDVENGESVEYLLYGTHNKPTPSDIGAVHVSRQYSGKDLLSMSEEGNFYITNAQNIPTGAEKAGYLRVIVHPTNSDEYRVIFWRNFNSTAEYVNVMTDGTWSGWKKEIQSSDIPKASTVSTYTGTGTAGQDNPCTLTFEAPPKMVMIMSPNATYVGFFIKGSNQYLVASANGFSTSGQECTWSGNTLSWHALSTGQYYQLNAGTQKYTYYVAY